MGAFPVAITEATESTEQSYGIAIRLSRFIPSFEIFSVFSGVFVSAA